MMRTYIQHTTTTTTTTIVLRPLYRSTCAIRHLQLRTGGSCWCKVLLPACPCWRQPAHSDQGEDVGVLLNSVIYTVCVSYFIYFHTETNIHTHSRPNTLLPCRGAVCRTQSWLHWCIPGWTMGTACWSAFRLTWRVDSGRSWTRWLDWSTAWGPATTYLMLSSICTGCRMQVPEWIQYKLFWRTRFYMAMLDVTSVRWPVSTTCLVDQHSVLTMPTASWYRPSNCQQSAAEPLRLRLHTSGIHCQLTSLRQVRCPPSVDCWNVSYSSNHILTSSTDITS